MIFKKEDFHTLFDCSMDELVMRRDAYKSKLDLCNEVLRLRKKNGEQVTPKSKPKQEKIENANAPFHQ